MSTKKRQNKVRPNTGTNIEVGVDSNIFAISLILISLVFGYLLSGV